MRAKVLVQLGDPVHGLLQFGVLWVQGMLHVALCQELFENFG